MAKLTSVIQEIACTDLFQKDSLTKELKTGLFIGRPFYLDYDRACLLVADAWKKKARGIPQGTCLLAYYRF